MPLFNGPVWWVDNQNNGSSDQDGSFSNPFSTIAQALKSANSSDTLKLKPGNYDENYFEMGINGISGNNNSGELSNLESITIIGVDGPDQTILNANFNSRIFRFQDMRKKYHYLGLHSRKWYHRAQVERSMFNL